MNDRRAQINNMLGRAGLATLENAEGLVQQLGYLVEGHDHFRRLLNRCEPEKRHSMYEALRPHLSFEPKPLDVYTAETGQDAEARQLPTIGPGGQLEPYKVADIRTAQAAVDEALAKGHLEVVCKGCTQAAVFPGANRADAIRKAREAGWCYDESAELCPDCQ